MNQYLYSKQREMEVEMKGFDKLGFTYVLLR